MFSLNFFLLNIFKVLRVFTYRKLTQCLSRPFRQTSGQVEVLPSYFFSEIGRFEGSNPGSCLANFFLNVGRVGVSEPSKLWNMFDRWVGEIIKFVALSTAGSVRSLTFAVGAVKSFYDRLFACVCLPRTGGQD